MIDHLKAARRRFVIRLTIAAAVLIALAMITGLMQRDPRVLNDRMDQVVLPEFALKRADTTQIEIELADDRYTLVAGANGWTMPEEGNYPIRADRLAVLANGLEDARWAETMTGDPAKFDRLSVGDPRTGGTGALVTVRGREGEVTAQLITGKKGDRFYARLPDDTRSYRMTGLLPPLFAKDAWLDFDIIDINPDAIMGVRITDATGREVFLSRGAGEDERRFRPSPPFVDDRLRDRLLASSTALALTRFAPVGVKPQTALTTQPYARHITMTFDGGEISVDAYQEPDGGYITLRAIEAGEGAYRAETINAKAAGWAFKLSDIDWRDITPTVNSLVIRPDPNAVPSVP